MARLYRQKSEATEDTLAKVEKVVRVIVVLLCIYGSRSAYIPKITEAYMGLIMALTEQHH